MKDKFIKFWLIGLLIVLSIPSFSQMQACPNNINFGSADLTSWSAYTGLLDASNPTGPLSSQQNFSAPNTGISTISEYNISKPGIQVITSSTTDLFGGFNTIPNINGYQYTNSVKLGSSANSHDYNTPGNPGGFVRGISYMINVPAGSGPYTMTYAYALVLENGNHKSDSQPQFKAVIIPSITGVADTCASKKYSLPTNFNNATGQSVLDTTAAIKQGFINSKVPFFSYAGINSHGTNLYDVWTKQWTEVTFDLSFYRGHQVSLTFETDNCAPGIHFAYAYIALRNSCGGLLISGDTTVCSNSSWTYSIPQLAGATYNWTVPNNWTTSATNTNTIKIVAGNGKGFIVATELSSCANLTDSIEVTAITPSIGGTVTGNNTVCTGINTSSLLLNGNTGNVLKWLSSPDGITWDSINDITTSYIAKNLTLTTHYKALVQTNPVCVPDTSSGVIIIVDPKSVGGSLSPLNTDVCEDQNKPAILTLTGNIGSVFNWLYSNNSSTWQNFSPVKNDSIFSIVGATVPTQYRVIVKSGVCEPDTSSSAKIAIYPAKYPQATVSPLDTTICYGTVAPLIANVTEGSTYSWLNHNSLYDPGDGTISYIPYTINASAAPSKSSYYILSILNTGCPVLFNDTIFIHVIPQIVVHAGRDTSVIASQPLQLQASLNDTIGVYNWLWSPASGLDNTLIANPIATLNSNIDSIRYIVKATNTSGCYGEDDMVVHVFKTGPEIFVPSAFTPNGDGKNDILKPIPVGITKLDFFRIYNRWGQLIYSTSIIGNGWDGTLNGTQQPSGAYVYLVQGKDYKSNIIFRKGTVVLIR